MEMLGQAAVFLWRCCANIGFYGSLRFVLVIEPTADQRRRFGQIAGEDVLAVIVATTHIACQRGGGIAGVIFNRHTVWHCPRSEEHTSELQSLMRNSYAVFCLQIQTVILYYYIMISS